MLSCVLSVFMLVAAISFVSNMIVDDNTVVAISCIVRVENMKSLATLL